MRWKAYRPRHRPRVGTGSWTGTEGRGFGRGGYACFCLLARFLGARCYYPTTPIEKIDSRAIYGQLKGIPDLGVGSKLDDSPDEPRPPSPSLSGAGTPRRRGAPVARPARSPAVQCWRFWSTNGSRQAEFPSREAEKWHDIDDHSILGFSSFRSAKSAREWHSNSSFPAGALKGFSDEKPARQEQAPAPQIPIQSYRLPLQPVRLSGCYAVPANTTCNQIRRTLVCDAIVPPMG